MRGDSIVIEPHHKRAAEGICDIILPVLRQSNDRFVLTVAGESGSGKSETAAAVAEQLAQSGIQSYIFQQDDYFVYPPKSNDQARRKDINWVGPQEVRLDLLDEQSGRQHLGFLGFLTERTHGMGFAPGTGEPTATGAWQPSVQLHGKDFHSMVDDGPSRGAEK